jgi:PAS domain S-box-containing protein
LISNTCEVCFGEEEAKKFRDDDLKVMGGGKQEVYEEKIIDSQKDAIWLETIKSPILDESGEVIGTVGIARDITTRKKGEEALRDSEERYRALADAAFEAIFISERGICTDTNQAATKMFGYEHDELIGIFGTDVIAPESKELVKHNMLSGHEEPYEVVAQRKDGTTFHTEIRGKMTQYKGKDVRITVVNDIDDRKRAEETLRQAHDELEMKVEERTAELVMSMDMLEKEIEERKRTELAIIERGKDLENKTHELEELNAALNVLLKRREQDKTELEEKVLVNMKELVFPYVEKLNNSRINDRQMVYLNIIKSNLENIIKPFLHRLSSKYSNLTPSEIQVAGLVKDGKTTKEIAELLNSSTSAIDFHRNNLRKKLGLRNTKTNLRSFLLSLT